MLGLRSPAQDVTEMIARAHRDSATGRREAARRGARVQ